MAQHIGIRKITESGELMQNYDTNFTPVANYVNQSKEKFAQYTWLSSIDEYGDTVINRLQSVHVIAELQSLLNESLDEESKQTANEVVNILKTIDTHEYIKFIGD